MEFRLVEEEGQQQHPEGNHAKSMDIKEDELEWAHQIKAKITGESKVRNISDYECAELAIVTLARQDMDEVLDRVYKLQCFVDEYKILQSLNKSYVEEGLETLQGYVSIMPGWLLSLDYLPGHGHYILTMDQSAFEPSKVKTEKEWRTVLSGFYFIFQIMNSNLSSVREGIASIVECKDMGFHNYSPYATERISTDIAGYYPYKQQQSLWLNTPTAANVLINCIKPFMPDDVNKTFQLGCKLPGYEEKIDTLFKTPTLEVAKNALLSRIEKYLTEREQNQLTYKLPPLPLGP